MNMLRNTHTCICTGTICLSTNPISCSYITGACLTEENGNEHKGLPNYAA